MGEFGWNRQNSEERSLLAKEEKLSLEAYEVTRAGQGTVRSTKESRRACEWKAAPVEPSDAAKQNFCEISPK